MYLANHALYMLHSSPNWFQVDNQSYSKHIFLFPVEALNEDKHRYSFPWKSIMAYNPKIGHFGYDWEWKCTETAHLCIQTSYLLKRLK